jgi:L-arabinose isomerase
MGNRFRMIANEVECVKPKPLPKLPVASASGFRSPTSKWAPVAWILPVEHTTAASLMI